MAKRFPISPGKGGRIYLKPNAKAKLNAVLRKESEQYKMAMQEGVNDFIQGVEHEAAKIAQAGNVPAVGTKSGTLEPKSGAMGHGYYHVKFHSGSIETNYETAAAAAVAKAMKERGDDYRVQIIPKAVDKPYTITSATRRLHARVGNVTKHGYYWEEGHKNIITKKQSRAEIVGRITAGSGGKEALKRHVRAALKRKGFTFRRGGSIDG